MWISSTMSINRNHLLHQASLDDFQSLQLLCIIFMLPTQRPLKADIPRQRIQASKPLTSNSSHVHSFLVYCAFHVFMAFLFADNSLQITVTHPICDHPLQLRAMSPSFEGPGSYFSPLSPPLTSLNSYT